MTLSQGVAVILLLGVCLCDVELTALNQQQLSRLPFGELEQFVYSNDRQSLLNKWNNNMNIDDYIYYTMLHIDNEFMDYNITETDQINTLQKQFEQMKQLVNDTYSSRSARRIPSRIQDLIFRNEFRQIFDYNNFNKTTLTHFLDSTKSKLFNKFTYNKPKDVTKGIHSSNNDKKQTDENINDISYIVTQNQLDQKLINILDKSFNTSSFKSTLIPWILENKYDKIRNHPTRIKNLLTMHTDTIIMYPNKVQRLIQDLIVDKKTNHVHCIRSIIKKLPMKQIKHLLTVSRGTVYHYSILNQYIIRLIPNELSLYEKQSWTKLDVIPNNIKWNYIRKLYHETRHIKWNENNCNIISGILFQYVIFMEQNYYSLDLKYPYDLHIVMKYLDLSQQYKNSKRLFIDASLNSIFTDVTLHTSSSAKELMKRMIEFLNTKHGMEYYVEFKNNEKYFFQSGNKHSETNITHDFMDNYKFLLPTHTLRMAEIAATLRRGDDVKNIKACSYLISQVQDVYFRETTLIKFDTVKNPSHFNLKDDEIKIYIKVRNVKDILVKLFEINTKSYFRDNKAPISSALNLDGLSAENEWIITENEIGLKTIYEEKELIIKFPNALLHKRGVYFLDLLSSGIHSRSIINIGTIKYMTKTCEAGHLFNLLDENNNIIKNGSILLNKHIYKTSIEDEYKHSILIPFTNSPTSKQGIILQRDDDPNFNVITYFHHQTDKYILECGFFIDRQQILSKRKATVMTRCGLFLNDKKHRISLQIIQNAKLMVRLNTANKDVIDIDKVFDDFKLFDNKESTVIIDIPNEVRLIKVTLNCEVESISTNKFNQLQKFTKTQSFEMNAIDDKFDIAQFFLVPQTNNRYIIALYGRNGDPISNQKVRVDLFPKHISYSNYITINDLYTDKYGRIYLPDLKDNFVKMKVSTSGSFSLEKMWNLKNTDEFVRISPVFNMLAGTSIAIPYATNNDFALFDNHFTKKYDENVKYDGDTSQVIVSNMEPGKYILKILGLEYDININVVKEGFLWNMDDQLFNINDNQITSLTTKNQLAIENVEYNKEKLSIKIKLNGGNSRTRLHIIGTHIMPTFDISRLLYRDLSQPDEQRMFLSSESNYYLTQREIDEEYRYVLEREQAPQFIGNSLTRPSLLVKPFEIGDTVTGKQDAAEGGSFHDEPVGGDTFRSANSHFTPRSDSTVGKQDTKDDASIDFLSKNGSIVLFNLKPDKNGIVTVDVKDMYQTNQNYIKIIAFDDENAIVKTHRLNHRKTEKVKLMDIDKKKDIEYEIPIFDQYVDNRMLVGLNPLYQYIDGYDIVLFNKSGDNYTINDFKSSQFEIYSNFDEIFDLLLTVSGNKQLNEWSFLKKWKTFNHNTKMKLYERYLSHELHLFLMKNDIDFFNDVCVIHIKSKLYKDFFDYYLLEDYDELIKYLKIYKIKKLNILEQILLAHFFKTKNEEIFSTLKYSEFNGCYDEYKYDSLRIDNKQFNKLFQTALNKKLIIATKPTVNPTENPSKSPSKARAKYKKKNSKRRLKEQPRYEDEVDEDDDDDDDDDEYFYDEHEELGGGYPDVHAYGAHARATSSSYVKQRGFMKKQKFFEQIQKTKEYKETYYWNINQKFNFISLNNFWCDFAIWFLNENDGKANKNAFLSQWFMTSTKSINEILFVLTLLDIPFSDNNNNNIQMIHNNPKDWNQNVTLVASLPSILFIKQLKKAPITSNNDTEQIKSVLIYSHYFDPNDKYQEIEHGNTKVKKEKFIESNVFIPGKIYGISVILINVVSYQQKLNILTQIPTGAIPMGGNAFRTKTHIYTLNAYSVKKFEYFFYFPSTGTFQIYPIIVSYQSTQEIIGSFNVNNGDSNDVIVKYPDKTSNKVTNVESWDDVSLHGDYNEIIQYLSTHNIYKTDLSRIYYKLSESVEFYDKIIDLLRGEYYYNDYIWSFQIYWIDDIISKQNENINLQNDLTNRLNILLEYISMKQTNINAFNPYFKSNNFIYDNINHNKYDYKEYIPLVNARKYVLGEQRKILNDRFKNQYRQFLFRSSFQSSDIRNLPFNELISATYYLLLQDRINEAMDLYHVIKEKSVDYKYKFNPLYSYFIGYLALYEISDHKHIINTISQITKRYSNVSLIESKRKLLDEFDMLLQDIMDLNSVITTETQSMFDKNVENVMNNDNDNFNTEEFMDFEINEEDKMLIIQSQNVNKFDINFYTINMEVLFSMNPSLILPSSQSSKSKNIIFSYIKPKQSISIDLTSQDNNVITETEILIPNELKNENVFIQIISSTMIVSKPYNDHQLIIQIQENQGKLKILTKDENNQLTFVPQAYIKVYSKIKNTDNQYKFYKDGYSDIRGLFDYISISTDDLDHTEKFILFVKHDKFGCTVSQANTPTR